jgi:hypothetical protein
MDEWQSNRAQDLSLRIDIRTLKTWLNDAEVQLPPSQFLLLLFLAVRATQNNSPGLPSYKDAATAFVPFLDGLKADTEIDPQHRLLPMFDRSWDDSFLNRTVSDLRKSLKAVGEGGDILANLLPNRGRFSLQLPSSSISILPRAPRK